MEWNPEDSAQAEGRGHRKQPLKIRVAWPYCLNVEDVMEKRHFEKIAQIIYTLPLYRERRRVVAEHFAAYLEGTNELFDRAKFLEACREGLSDES